MTQETAPTELSIAAAHAELGKAWGALLDRAGGRGVSRKRMLAAAQAFMTAANEARRSAERELEMGARVLENVAAEATDLRIARNSALSRLEQAENAAPRIVLTRRAVQGAAAILMANACASPTPDPVRQGEVVLSALMTALAVLGAEVDADFELWNRPREWSPIVAGVARGTTP